MSLQHSAQNQSDIGLIFVNDCSCNGYYGFKVSPSRKCNHKLWDNLEDR